MRRIHTRALQAPVRDQLAIDVGGSAIGGISLHIGSDIERIGAEMGYWIGEEFWGRGIVTAAMGPVTAYALYGSRTAAAFLRCRSRPTSHPVAPWRRWDSNWRERCARAQSRTVVWSISTYMRN